MNHQPGLLHVPLRPTARLANCPAPYQESARRLQSGRFPGDGPCGPPLSSPLAEVLHDQVLAAGLHAVLWVGSLTSAAVRGEEGFVALFEHDGPPSGWSIRAWNDLSKEVKGVVWTVKDGVLSSTKQRDVWLVSDREYGDFILEFEIKLGELGNSGVAVRADVWRSGLRRHGDAGCRLPVQHRGEDSEADRRHLPRPGAATKQVYRPTQWNAFRIKLKGDRLKVTANGELIQDVDLRNRTSPSSGTTAVPAPPIKDRPRRGHIGFQYLSRDGCPCRSGPHESTLRDPERAVAGRLWTKFGTSPSSQTVSGLRGEMPPRSTLGFAPNLRARPARR